MKNKFKQISFIGFGLINSSLARVVKKNSLANKILAYSRTKDTRIKIENLNIVDEITDDLNKAVENADLIILGVPVGAMEDVVKKCAKNISAGTIITDVGSIKKSIIDSIIPI